MTCLTDELDDEEFFDDQLEAYFKRLLPPAMQRGVIEGQEIQDAKLSSYMVRHNGFWFCLFACYKY